MAGARDSLRIMFRKHPFKVAKIFCISLVMLYATLLNVLPVAEEKRNNINLKILFPDNDKQMYVFFLSSSVTVIFSPYSCFTAMDGAYFAKTSHILHFSCICSGTLLTLASKFNQKILAPGGLQNTVQTRLQRRIRKVA